jgi:hypothetical protein
MASPVGKQAATGILPPNGVVLSGQLQNASFTSASLCHADRAVLFHCLQVLVLADNDAALDSKGSGKGDGGRRFHCPAATSAETWQMCGLRGRTCLGKAGGGSHNAFIQPVSYRFDRSIFCGII